MKYSLIIILCFFCYSSTVMADESIDSLAYYYQLIDSSTGEVVSNGYENLLRIYKNSHEDISQDTTYARLLNDYAHHLCMPWWNLEKAIELSTEATNIYKAFEGNGLLYAKSLENLAHPYSLLDKHEEAIRLMEEAIEIKKKLLGPNDLDYAYTLHTLAYQYLCIGNYNEAIRFNNLALEINKEAHGLEHPDYTSLIQKIESDYSIFCGMYSSGYRYDDDIKLRTEMLRLRAELTEIKQKLSSQDHKDYIESLIDLSSRYHGIGDFNKAQQLCNDAMKTYTRISKTLDTLNSFSIIENLAMCYSNLGDYNEAIQLETQAMEKARRISDAHYAKSLISLANYYYESGEPREAIHFGEKAIGIMKCISVSYLTYNLSLRRVAEFYASIGNYNEAIRLAYEAFEHGKKYTILSIHIEDYWIDLIRYYSKAGKYSEAVTHLSEFVPLIRDIAFNTFLMQTANFRQHYWSPINSFLNSDMPLILIHAEATDKASMLYDNTALLTKGLLLSTEIEMNTLIQESNDPKALQLFSELQNNRQILNNQYSIPITQRTIDCDSLVRASERIEHILVSRVNEFGDYTRNLGITWQDVKNKLGDNDIAIEFLSYPELDNITTFVALTLCNNDTAPMLTPLFTEIELNEVTDSNDTFLNEKTDSLIWGPLSNRLADKSHVYFSASGMLHSIGIEYLPSMERKDCYRLSSTRELVTHQPAQPISSATSATIFGGINYNATYTSIKKAEPQYVKDYYAKNTVPRQKRGSFDYRSIQRYGVRRLPDSQAEMQEIFAMLKDQHVNCDTLSGIQASEESFKALSGQRKSLLHISTPGFYYTPEETENLNDHLQRMLIGNDRPAQYEDLSLLRCWLCFAGADLAICDTLPEEKRPTTGQDDGILNALEIAQMDLRGLDLVVLSACQTALGDVVDGEGVFGLQRGFKKAGAQSILMSLWEVDDKVTHLFMTEFYRAWISDMTKIQALRKAQAIVKQKYPDPLDWAAFILLDALD